MNDRVCVSFLQWLLPQLHMRWEGFRKVRRQVCRRIERRIKELGLPDCNAYKDYLSRHRSEWRLLDQLCRVTISRFYRDHPVFSCIGLDILPALADEVMKREERTIRIWSAGCASGEEPYSIALLFHYLIGARYPEVDLQIIATDSDPVMIKRAETASYTRSSLRELPEIWVEETFAQDDETYSLGIPYKKHVQFIRQDIRHEAPAGRFQMILCRNLAFTYFDQGVQSQVLKRLHEKLESGGILVCGSHEQLPPNNLFSTWLEAMPIFEKKAVFERK